MRVSRSVLPLLFASLTVALIAKDFTLPHANDARTYAAHEAHADEHVTIAVDPYDTPAKAEIFKTDWREHDFLPVLLVVSNDRNGPIALNDMKVQWVTANRSKLSPATDDDLARRLAKVKNPSRRTFPNPLPNRGPAPSMGKAARQEVDAAQFRALAVEPHTTKAGFLFFDIQDIKEPLAGAHVYVSGVKGNNGQELFYFDIPVQGSSGAQAQGPRQDPGL
jgi:hypothetical protein